MSKEQSKSVPVRMDAELQSKITEAAKKTGLPKQEIIRLCTAIGIEDLRKVGWDLAKLVSDAAEKRASRIELMPDQEKRKENGL